MSTNFNVHAPPFIPNALSSNQPARVASNNFNNINNNNFHNNTNYNMHYNNRAMPPQQHFLSTPHQQHGGMPSYQPQQQFLPQQQLPRNVVPPQPHQPPQQPPPPMVVYICSESAVQRNAMASYINDKYGYTIIEDDWKIDRENTCGAERLFRMLQDVKKPTVRGYVISGFIRLHKREALCMIDAIEKNGLKLHYVFYSQNSTLDTVVAELKNTENMSAEDAEAQLHATHSLSFEVAARYFDEHFQANLITLDPSGDWREIDRVLQQRPPQGITLRQILENERKREDDELIAFKQVSDVSLFSNILRALKNTCPASELGVPPLVIPGVVLDYAHFSRRFHELKEYRFYNYGIGIKVLLVCYKNEYYVIMPQATVIFNVPIRFLPQKLDSIRINNNNNNSTKDNSNTNNNDSSKDSDAGEKLDFVLEVIVLETSEQFGIFLHDVVSWKGRRGHRKWSDRHAQLKALLEPDDKGKEREHHCVMTEFVKVENLQEYLDKLKSSEVKKSYIGLCFVHPGRHSPSPETCVDYDTLIYLFPESGVDARLWNARETENGWVFELFLVNNEGVEKLSIGEVTINSDRVIDEALNDGHIVRVKRGEDGAWQLVERKTWDTAPMSESFYKVDGEKGVWSKYSMAAACSEMKNLVTGKENI